MPLASTGSASQYDGAGPTYVRQILRAGLPPPGRYHSQLASCMQDGSAQRRNYNSSSCICTQYGSVMLSTVPLRAEACAIMMAA